MNPWKENKKFRQLVSALNVVTESQKEQNEILKTLLAASQARNKALETIIECKDRDLKSASEATIMGAPEVTELQRLVDLWFDSRPMSTAYAVIEGDEEGRIETGSFEELYALDTEQEQVKNSAVRLMWLSAVRKRLARTD